MKKTLSLVVTMLVIVAVLAACGSNNKGNNAGTGENGAGAGNDGGKKKRIALVLPEKIGVNPFFATMDEGLKKAGKDFGVEVKTIESTDPAALEQNLRATVAENYDLIITATFQAEDALTKVATENPDKPFAIIDTTVDLPNVRSVKFREQEAAYVLGAAAGLSTKTNVVGAVVAMDTPLLKKYTSGFEQGLKATNPDAKFLINYVGSFVDSPKAKELALLQYSQKADFVAGMSAVGDLGVFEAAKEKNLYASGQDIDRTLDDPEHIVLSQLKGTDTVTYETVKDFVGGNFEFSSVDYGLKEKGVGVTFITNETTSQLSPFIGQETVDKVKAIAEDIISGKIVVQTP
ncbi:BMP family lipoprotein [Paenibacillus radicis (ex Gao et al. 2016)]|uniref:BMP family ABC transporter substrate-binding protein n=1 Tax=Paenibacillus radicis (ex Gao et al. 2016) TaxID=1737354 RepID=A0A917HNG9_9BACL|nr:BMP family protein [Paenibacillus radicis (ex Gao et al. 2016)]GGG84072.1 BMP family ABC transporter substrate-binding protein [Paenibacillus radicis (ex Gao et al. 2016)]